jgi:hypothetical protein
MVKAVGLLSCAASGTLSPEHKVSIPDDINIYRRQISNSNSTIQPTLAGLLDIACPLKMGADILLSRNVGDQIPT